MKKEGIELNAFLFSLLQFYRAKDRQFNSVNGILY